MNRSKNILFDFGCVLTLEQNRECFAPVLENWGLQAAAFFDAWAACRLPFDAGQLSPAEYWSKVFSACLPGGTTLDAAQLAWLGTVDMEAFKRPRETMHRLAKDCIRQGVPTGILSNMPQGHGARWLQHWPHLQTCNHILWSGEEGLIKPDPAIYRRFLERSGWLPRDTLFIDDNLANIRAAKALGFAVHHFLDEGEALAAAEGWLRQS